MIDFKSFQWYPEELKYLTSHFSKERVKADEKYSIKSFKVKQNVASLGLFFDSIDSPNTDTIEFL